MEEDWWNAESSQKFSSDTPPAIVIVDAQKGSNILSGVYNQVFGIKLIMIKIVNFHLGLGS